MPPKLQRRGLVFKGKMVTMKRAGWVTMMRVYCVIGYCDACVIGYYGE